MDDLCNPIPDIAPDNDGGQGRNAQISATLPAAGTYFIIVEDFRSGTGTYEVDILKAGAARACVDPFLGDECQIFDADVADFGTVAGSCGGGTFDDCISSIELVADSTMRVCTDANFTGECRTFDTNIANFAGVFGGPCSSGYDDCISSLKIDPPLADLVVEQPGAAPSTSTELSPVTLTAQVRNQGAGTADSSMLYWYYSSDSTIETGDTAICCAIAVGTLAPGASSPQTLQTTGLPAGNGFIGACINPFFGGAVEGDQSNQCSAGFAVTVNPASGVPDLLTKNLGVFPTNPTVGSTITLSAEVENSGSGDAQAATVTWKYFGDPANPVTLDTTPVAALTAGTQTTQTLQTTDIPAGTWSVETCVDSVPGEVDTTNQCTTAGPITVTSMPGVPDLELRISSLSYPPATPVGGRIVQVADIHNIGTAVSGATIVSWNYDIADGGGEMGRSTMGPLDPGAMTRVTLELNGIPTGSPQSLPGIPVGFWLTTACVREVPGETITSNNCVRAYSVQVTPAPRTVVVCGNPSPLNSECVTITAPGSNLTDVVIPGDCGNAGGNLDNCLEEAFVPPGTTAKFCSEPDGAGECISVSSDTVDFSTLPSTACPTGTWADCISSIFLFTPADILPLIFDVLD